jgi:hypothetical protein
MAITILDCAFVMLDVLGFKYKLNGSNRTREFSEFLTIVADAVRAFGGQTTGDIFDLLRNPHEKCLQYSDTLIYWQEITPSIPAHDAIVSAGAVVHRVTFHALERGFLLRGALSRGELLLSDAPSAIAGPVINECATHCRFHRYQIIRHVAVHCPGRYRPRRRFQQ